MTAVDFGAAFQKRQSGDMKSVMESLIAAIRADVIADLREGNKPPVVNIAPAQVSVAAPNVTVTPTINVPESEPADVNVTVDMAALSAKMDLIHTDLQSLLTLLARPVTKTVERAAGGLIKSITETR